MSLFRYVTDLAHLFILSCLGFMTDNKCSYKSPYNYNLLIKNAEISSFFRYSAFLDTFKNNKISILHMITTRITSSECTKRNIHSGESLIQTPESTPVTIMIQVDASIIMRYLRSNLIRSNRWEHQFDRTPVKTFSAWVNYAYIYFTLGKWIIISKHQWWMNKNSFSTQ